MKKLVFLLVCVFTVSTVAMADNEKPIQVGQLPTKAQTFITTYFKGHKVALAKLDSDLFSKSYDVIFTNGEKIEFDKSGDWTEVKCKSGVPTQIVPSAIRTAAKLIFILERFHHITFSPEIFLNLKLSRSD